VTDNHLWPAIEPRDRVAVGGAGGGEVIVAFSQVLATVEELLFELGDSLSEVPISSVPVIPVPWKTCSPSTSDSLSESLVVRAS
jgi:hypothetical protein